MDAPKFNVVMTGELVVGANREHVVAMLAQRYKLDLPKAAAMLGGKPTTVKRDVEGDVAKRLVGTLLQMGALARVQPAGLSAGVATDAHEPQLAMTMPAPAAAARVAPPPAAPAPAAPAPVAPPRAAVQAPDPRGWRFSIEGAPDFAYVEVEVPAGETLKVEASAMATMDTNISMKTRLRGGLSRFVTGESIFMNEFTAEGGAGRVGIAPGPPGDLRHIYLDGSQTIYLQNSGYLASTLGVTIESKWQGLTKGFFSGESLFLIRASGQGDLWFSSYGGIIEIDVAGDYVVDTGNIVAFTEGLQYNITKVGGYKSLFFSGEGLVCRFSGQGKVWVQTRKANAFVAWAFPFRPVKQRQ